MRIFKSNYNNNIINLNKTNNNYKIIIFREKFLNWNKN